MIAQRPSRQSRARHQKSRNGCSTCRARHVRCDEAFPRCRNCTETGRRCEGVSPTRFRFVHTTSPPADQQNVELQLTVPSPPSTNRPSLEQRSFGLFMAKVAPLFSTGELDKPYWAQLIPQLSQTHLSIWYAVNTIALLFEHPMDRAQIVHPRDRWQSVNPKQLLALEWYGKAVSKMNETLPHEEDKETWALTTCSLFIGIEFQQGNLGNGFAMLGQGFALLEAKLRSYHENGPQTSLAALDQIVVPFISKHALFMASFGLSFTAQWGKQFTRPDTTVLTSGDLASRLDILKLELSDITCLCYETVRGCRLVLFDPVENAKQTPRRRDGLSQLLAWRERLYSQTQGIKSRYDSWLISRLLMHFGVSYIWISTCQNALQSSFDSYHKDFEQIIEHAQEMLILADHPDVVARRQASPSGCIPPLYFTASKCRDPILRRRALSLLDRAPIEDSLWTVLPAQRIIRGIITFEEDKGTEVLPYCATSELRQLPSDERRVHHIEILPPSLSGAPQQMAINLWTYNMNVYPPRPQEHIRGLPEPGDQEIDRLLELPKV